MSQKLTLARYLEGRGSVKSLTRIEAEAFGVPYPLVSGWPARHGDMEITQPMLDDLAQRIASARRSTASKALRGLDGAGASGAAHHYGDRGASPAPAPAHHPEPQRAVAAPSFPGFVLRPTKRARAAGMARIGA